MKGWFLALCVVLTGFGTHAHFRTAHTPSDSLLVRVDTFPSRILTETNGRGVRFQPVIRPLVPIPGGRQAYFTYLWDFGDGQFSTAEVPEHQYRQPGEYEVSLYVVNNYDNGPRPRKPKTRVRVDSNLAVAEIQPNLFEQRFFKSNGVFQLYKNADAVPGEDMALIVGVKPTAASGKVLILTNELSINPDGFRMANQSRYNNERLVPVERPEALNSMWARVSKAIVTQSGSPDYGNMEVLDFAENEASDYFNSLLNDYKTVSLYEIEGAEGESQFSLINLDITPEMLADTNAIVTITGIYLADKGEPIVHKLDVPITTSHDPNKMSVRPALLDYRLQYKKKELTYKVQFQNDGEGDARVVRLEMALPEQVDPSTFKLLNLYPACDTCATEEDLGCYTWEIQGENKLVFQFRGIALPGTASPTVTDPDSTKGFIRFSVRTHRKLQKTSLPSYTDIYFDKNDPIRTNRAVARFRPGLSPLITAGFNTPGGSTHQEGGIQRTHGYSLGVGLSPIAPYRRPYWQIELYASTFGSKFSKKFPNSRGEVAVPSDAVQDVFRMYSGLDSVGTDQYLSLQVPLLIRYNFNRWISAGVGAVAETQFHLDGERRVTYQLIDAAGQLEPMSVAQHWSKSKSRSLQFSPLLDLTIGRVYLGPSFGLRYQYDKSYKNNLNLYLMWRL